MAIEYMVAVLNHSRARLGDRLVMLALANHADAHGRAWPSIGKIAEGAGMSERQVQRALRKMEKMGELVLERRGGQFQGQNYANNFRITLPLFTKGGAILSGGGDKSGKKQARNVTVTVRNRHKNTPGASPGRAAQARPASLARVSDKALDGMIGRTRLEIRELTNPVGRAYATLPTDPAKKRKLEQLQERLDHFRREEKRRREAA